MPRSLTCFQTAAFVKVDVFDLVATDICTGSKFFTFGSFMVNVWLYGFWSDPSHSLLALLVFFLVLLLNLEFQGLIVVHFHRCHSVTLGTPTSLLARHACG